MGAYKARIVQDRVLIIDDDQDVQRLLKVQLSQGNFALTSAFSGADGINSARETHFDLILLDLMLPDMTGFDVLTVLKSKPQTASTPVIMLTSHGEDEHVVRGLELGAEDYVVKPFSWKVLLSRVKTVLRRGKGAEEEILPEAIITVGSVSVFLNKKLATADGQPLPLQPIEYLLLSYFAEAPGKIFTAYQIVERLKRDSQYVSASQAESHLQQLRHKLNNAGGGLQSIVGVGYRFGG